MTEPNIRAWSREAVRAYLESQANVIDGLTAEDLAAYVKMRQTFDGWQFAASLARGGGVEKRKAEERAYHCFRQARAGWWKAMHRIHPPRPVQTFTQEGT